MVPWARTHAVKRGGQVTDLDRIVDLVVTAVSVRNQSMALRPRFPRWLRKLNGPGSLCRRSYQRRSQV